MLNMNTEALIAKLQKERDQKEKGGKGGKDLRFLNYFDLEFGQEIVIRLLPDGDDSGDLYKDYSTHGPNLKNPAIERISCAYKTSNEKCPACGHSYMFHQDGDKENAKKWRTKDTTIAQCIVIDSPIEISEAADGNPIKLMYLPWGMKEVIVDSILNGTVSDPTEINFVIKKSKNPGGCASYDPSYFKLNDTRDIPDDVIEALNEGIAHLYVLGEETPAAATAEEVQVWLDNAIDVMANKTTNTKPSSPTNDSGAEKAATTVDGGQPKERTSSTSLLEKLQQRKRA
jgi:Zn ribbon nucleic-acid-binding protein